MSSLVSRLAGLARSTEESMGHGSATVRAPFGRETEVTAPVASSPRLRTHALPAEVGPSRDGLLKRLLAFADALAALLAAGSLALAVDQPLATAFWASTSIPLWLVLSKLHGLYDRDERVLHHLTADELPAIAAWAVTGSAGMIVVLTLSPAPIPRLSAIALAAVIAGIAAVLLRAGARALWRSTTLPEGALVVGAGDSRGRRGARSTSSPTCT